MRLSNLAETLREWEMEQMFGKKDYEGTHGFRRCVVCARPFPKTQYNGKKKYCCSHCRYIGYQIPKRQREREVKNVA